MIITLRTNLKSGPRFAKVCCDAILSPSPLPKQHFPSHLLILGMPKPQMAVQYQHNYHPNSRLVQYSDTVGIRLMANGYWKHVLTIRLPDTAINQMLTVLAMT